MPDVVLGSTAAALVIASWVIGVRIIYKISRDISVIAQRLAYIEGKLNGGLPDKIGENE